MDLKKPPRSKDAKRKPKPGHEKKFPRADERRFFLSPKAGKIIGVTGGVATGKTFVLECFKKLGFEVFNADTVVHDLLKRDGKAFKEVAEIFPSAVTDEGIERKIVSEDILNNPPKLSQLESILHPLVRNAQVEFMVKVKQSSGKSMVFEVPLLFENSREKYYDYIIVTSASPAIQKERASLRSNMSEEKFALLMKRQLPTGLKEKKAHFVIRTNKNHEDTFNQVKRIVGNEQVKRDSFRHRNDRPKP